MLKFHETLLQESLNKNNSLVIVSAGLSYELVVSGILNKYFEKEKKLVFILGATPNEKSFLRLINPRIQIINAKTVSGKDRMVIYKEKSGAFFITERILVCDLLEDKVPLKRVGGFIILHSEKLSSKNYSTFCLDVFYRKYMEIEEIKRKKSSNSYIPVPPKHVFIRGFSNYVPPFRNFGIMKDIMNNIYTNELILYPRFEDSVRKSLSQNCSYNEVPVPMGEKQGKIHEHLSILLKLTLQKLVKNNPTKDVVFSFEKFVYGNPAQYPPKELKRNSRIFYEEAYELRRMLLSVLTHDSPTFYSYVYSLLDNFSGDQKNAPNWVNTDEGLEILRLTKARVYTITKKTFSEPSRKRQRTLTQMNRGDEPEEEKEEYEVKWSLEANSKWKLLCDVLLEIRGKMKVLSERNSKKSVVLKLSPVVLVLVNSMKKARIISRILEMGIEEYLVSKARRFVRIRVTREEDSIGVKWWRFTSSHRKGMNFGKKNKNKRKQHLVEEEHEVEFLKKFLEENKYERYHENKSNFNKNMNKNRNMFGGGKKMQNNKKKMKSKSIIGQELEKEFEESFQEIDPSQAIPDPNICPDPIVIVHPTAQLSEVLEKYRPVFVVLYDLNQESVHCLEEYYNRHYPSIPLQLYSLVYENSFEYERHIWKCKYERDCWLQTIRNKQSLVLPSIEETVIYRFLSNPQKKKEKKMEEEEEEELIDTRRREVLGLDPKKKKRKKKNLFFQPKKKKKKESSAMDPTNSTKSLIFVDSREFRCDLPITLNSFGFTVIPKTLPVGDYILSRRLCIERKSPSDLSQSLNHGRLLSQCDRMSKKYEKVAVLIEFEDRKFSCSLFHSNELYSRISLGNVPVKLFLLIRSFPRVKLLWSRGSEDTAKLFLLLKENEKEEDRMRFQKSGDEEQEITEEEGLWLNNDSGNTSGNLDGDDDDKNSYHDSAVDILRKLPGITDKNYLRVMDKVENLSELAKMSKVDLQKLLGKRSGEDLFFFLTKGQLN